MIHLADLFCGAGGTSQGAIEAIEALGHKASLTAVNHWDVAIATHTALEAELKALRGGLMIVHGEVSRLVGEVG